MNVIYRGIAVLSALSLVGGCNSLPKTGPAIADHRPCAKQFAVEGSALNLSGTHYSTSMFVPGVSQKIAMDKASRQIALDGMTITTLDREAGLITASNKIIAGKGDTAPLVSTFTQVKGGIQVTLKFSNGFGQITTEEIVKNGFCSILSSVEKK